jgi:hypothetical protein
MENERDVQSVSAKDVWCAARARLECIADAARRARDGLRSPWAGRIEGEAEYSLDQLAIAEKFLNRARAAIVAYEKMRKDNPPHVDECEPLFREDVTSGD